VLEWFAVPVSLEVDLDEKVRIIIQLIKSIRRI